MNTKIYLRNFFLLFLALEILAQGLIFFFYGGASPWLAQEDQHLGWKFSSCTEELCFNTQGIRHPQKVSTPSKFLILGDSIVVGRDLPLEKTFAYQLGAVNAGVIGYSLYQLRDLLHELKKDFSAQKTILVINSSRLMGHSEAKMLEQQTLNFNGYIRPQSFFKRLLRQEALWQLYLKGAAYLNKKFELALDTQALAAAMKVPSDQDFVQIFAAVEDIARISSSFLLVLVPARALVEDYQKEHKLPFIHQRLQQFCQEKGLPFLDLTAPLSQDKARPLYLDPFHFNQQGHQWVAATLRVALDEP